MSALFDSEHLDDTVHALLDLLCPGNLQDVSQNDNDPFLTFINQEYYLAQSEMNKIALPNEITSLPTKCTLC